MIKSKKAVLIDSRTGEEAVIYFSAPVEQKDDVQELVSYLVCVFKKLPEKDAEGNDVFVELPEGQSRIPAVYKMSTWLALFGDMTQNQFNAQRDDLMIQQIGQNSAQYWGLTVNDLEKA